MKGINKEKLKTLNGGYSNTFKVTVLLIVCVLGVLALNFISSFKLRDTVTIVKFKSAVAQDGIVSEDAMYKDTMQRAEYEKAGVMKFSDGSTKRQIILWDDRSKIIGAFASHYIMDNVPVYWKSLTKEAPKRYSYLYKMDGELLKLDIRADQFGEMLVPGDKINVRATYEENNFTLPNEEEFNLQQQTGIQAQTSVPKRIKLFNNAVVLDILNSEGASIFDIYYQVLALPKDAQMARVNSEDFREVVKPVQILLNVTPEEADRYMDIQSKGPTYLTTLLPRSSGNLITEALNQLQTGFARQQEGQ